MESEAGNAADVEDTKQATRHSGNNANVAKLTIETINASSVIH